MDFTLVNEITIPEGAVLRLSQTNTTLWEKQSVPSSYKQLTYIETDGNQYIDTGVLAQSYSAGLSYVMQGCVTGYLVPTGNNYLFGCLYNNCRSGNLSISSGSIRLYIGGNSHQIFSGELAANEDFYISMTAVSSDLQNITLSINGTPLEQTATGVACQMPAANIYLLSCNGVGATSKPFMGKLYNFQINDADGTPIRNYLPCRRTSDNTIGLYDTVEGMFYENTGTGSFIAGEAL